MELLDRHHMLELGTEAALVRLKLREAVMVLPVVFEEELSAIPIVHFNQVCEIFGIDRDLAVDLGQRRH